MSQVFWGINYGESLIHFISSFSQEHFKVTYSCKAVWPWVQVLCPRSSVSPTVPLSSSSASHEGQKLGLVWVGNELRFGPLLLSKQSSEEAVGMPWKWGTGSCCSHGELAQHWYKWCCQSHHGSLRNGRLFWVNYSSKKYN